MTHMHDRQLEHNLDQLGLALAERAPGEVPDALHSAMARKRRAVVVRRVALAAAIVLVAGGAFVVYLAAGAWAPKASSDRLADPRRGAPPSVPEVQPMAAPASQTIAGLTGTWQRTGDIDLHASPRAESEPPYHAGDATDPARVEAASGPLR